MSTAETSPEVDDNNNQEQQNVRHNNEGEEKILRTSDLYRTKNLPERFDKPGKHS